jgi:uncharacterized protein YggU (UPF0235/DUF167 family)
MGLTRIFQVAMQRRLTAPPVNGKANRQLAARLAGQFGVSKSAMHI